MHDHPFIKHHEQYRGYIYQWLRRRDLTDDEAEEVCQHCCFKTWRSLHNVPTVRPALLAYLRAVAHSQFAEYVTRKHSLPSSNLPSEFDIAEDVQSRHVATADFLKRIVSILHERPELEPVFWAWMNNDTQIAASAELGITVSKFKTQWQKVIHFLRSRLKDDDLDNKGLV